MFLYQVIVWIDEKEARILRFSNGIEHQLTIDAHAGALADNERGAGDNAFFERVARALDIADEILIVGPAVTKDEFLRFMHKNEHSADPRILGVETIEEPTESNLSAYTKLYFANGTSYRAKRPRGNGSGDNDSSS